MYTGHTWYVPGILSIDTWYSGAIGITVYMYTGHIRYIPGILSIDMLGIQ